MDTDEGLVGHWPFRGDCEEASRARLRTRAHDVTIRSVRMPNGCREAAVFDGGGSVLSVDNPPALGEDGHPFTVATWLATDAGEGDVVGDLAARFDPASRCGWTLSVVTNGGVTTTPLANDRHVQFGIDQARGEPGWTDHGRPGNAVQIAALEVSEGELFAGTLEVGEDRAGHLWRHEGGASWQDLGACPDGSNEVASVTRFGGDLYCSTGRYDLRGSVLGPQRNTRPGGNVYRIEGDGTWVDCGRPGTEGARPDDEDVPGFFTDKADHTICLMPFGGSLLAVSNHRRGVWRHEGGTDWRRIGPDERLLSLAVWRRSLYALVNGGGVLRYEGDDEWASCGAPATSTQTYSAAIYANEFYVGTWPEGEVYRYAGGVEWQKVARLGYEREIMAMAVYNGKLYAGALPMGSVYRMDGDRFTFLGVLDESNVLLRRVWSMAVHGGRLFAGTLPSGRVLSYASGVMATADRAIEPGWRHVAAVRDEDRLRVYVDGKLTAESTRFRREDYAECPDVPLRIGQGQHAALDGALSDLRLYDRALTAEEVAALMAAR